jgi:hypothetical protein
MNTCKLYKYLKQSKKKKKRKINETNKKQTNRDRKKLKQPNYCTNRILTMKKYQVLWCKKKRRKERKKERK